MANETKPDGVRAAQTQSAPTLRKTSNILALSIAAYREGDLDTAFDLFIEGMESNLREGELSSASPDFAALIEEALSEARTRYDGDATESTLIAANVNGDDDDDLLAGADLTDGLDDDDGLGDDSEVSGLDDETLEANLASL